MTAVKKEIIDNRFNDPDYILRTQRIPHEGMPPMDTQAPPIS